MEDLIRWNLLLQQYSFSISYCKGIDNAVSEFLIRHLGGNFREEQENKALLIASINQFYNIFTASTETSILVIVALHENIIV